MATKLERNQYPAGLGPGDFKCYGPAATKDTEFNGSRMADMGCFQQEGVDSNKYYHACMCTDPSGVWYLYVQYGRVGAGSPSFQFTKCSSEAECQKAYNDQCAEKNTKRGEWTTIGGLKLFRPANDSKGKPKDLYVVRDLAKRDVGLPDAKNIVSASVQATAVTKVVKGGKTKKASFRCDAESTKLMKDLQGGAVTFTRSNIQGGTIPSQSACDGGRDIIQNVLQRIAIVGPDVKKQIADHQIRQLSYTLYGMIPKIKPLHCPEEEWILSDYTTNARRQSNIDIWKQDIDAFEAALKSGDIEEVVEGEDPFSSMPHVTLEHILPSSDMGKWLLDWWPKASRNRHAGVGNMRIHKMWKVEREGDLKTLQDFQCGLHKDIKGKKWNEERPLHQQTKSRPDLTSDQKDLYWETNTALTFHGTRTVNVPGILRENLRLPKTLVGVVITGAMFGPGLYFADDWRKSNGYTSDPGSYWCGGSGAVAGRRAFMFACDTVMGHPHVADGPHGYVGPPKGSHCVFGKGGHSRVQNNEWIVFERNRNALRYLIEYSTRD